MMPIHILLTEVMISLTVFALAIGATHADL